MSKLRILADARKFGDGGIGYYLSWLTSGLGERNDIELTLVVADEGQVPESTNLHKLIVSRSKKYGIAELDLLRTIPRDSYDLFHAPHYTLPWMRGKPSVVTIHDLIHVTHPSKRYHPPLAMMLVFSALRRATRVITVSTAVKMGIVARFPWAERKISVIGHPRTRRSVDAAESTAEPFLLCVISQDRPHKGIGDLLHTLKAIGAELPLPVVIVGYGTTKYMKQKIGDAVFIRGALPERDLHDLYARCSGVIVPSRAEGFGLPVVEAKTFGKRVLIRPVDALQELVGPKDLVANGMRLEDLSRAVIRFAHECTRDAKGSELDEKRFDPELLVEETVRVYRSASEHSA